MLCYQHIFCDLLLLFLKKNTRYRFNLLILVYNIFSRFLPWFGLSIISTYSCAWRAWLMVFALDWPRSVMGPACILNVDELITVPPQHKRANKGSLHLIPLSYSFESIPLSLHPGRVSIYILHKKREMRVQRAFDSAFTHTKIVNFIIYYRRCISRLMKMWWELWRCWTDGYSTASRAPMPQ